MENIILTVGSVDGVFLFRAFSPPQSAIILQIGIFKALSLRVDTSGEKTLFSPVRDLWTQKELDKKLYIWKYLFFEFFEMRYFLWVSVAPTLLNDCLQVENSENSCSKTRKVTIWLIIYVWNHSEINLNWSKIVFHASGNVSAPKMKSICEGL